MLDIAHFSLFEVHLIYPTLWEFLPSGDCHYTERFCIIFYIDVNGISWDERLPPTFIPHTSPHILKMVIVTCKRDICWAFTSTAGCRFVYEWHGTIFISIFLWFMTYHDVIFPFSKSIMCHFHMLPLNWSWLSCLLQTVESWAVQYCITLPVSTFRCWYIQNCFLALLLNVVFWTFMLNHVSLDQRPSRPRAFARHVKCEWGILVSMFHSVACTPVK
jgi:hypothetical protein